MDLPFVLSWLFFLSGLFAMAFGLSEDVTPLYELIESIVNALDLEPGWMCDWAGGPCL